MPTILKREFAPISDEAWQALDAEAGRILRQNLAGRRVVDFSGPHGWELGAVNLGRLKLGAKKAPGGVPWGIREVLPLIEIRLPFSLGQMEIDNLTRGRADVDLGPLQQTAERVAAFEDGAVFQGFAAGGIEGIAKAAAHKPVRLPKDVNQYPAAVSQAAKAIATAGVGGPYALVLGTEHYFTLMQTAKHGYPPQRVIQDVLGGPILRSPVLAGGIVLATRGGDFELTVGKDFSLGYASHDRDTIEFFLTESFTFRVIEPNAAVELAPPA
jgi:uncharacterized linocin/CFP29 family protein